MFDYPLICEKMSKNEDYFLKISKRRFQSEKRQTTQQQQQRTGTTTRYHTLSPTNNQNGPISTMSDTEEIAAAAAEALLGDASAERRLRNARPRRRVLRRARLGRRASSPPFLTLKKMDKDRFRQGLGDVVESYHQVADRLGMNIIVD